MPLRAFVAQFQLDDYLRSEINSGSNLIRTKRDVLTIAVRRARLAPATRQDLSNFVRRRLQAEEQVLAIAVRRCPRFEDIQDAVVVPIEIDRASAEYLLGRAVAIAVAVLVVE